MDDQYARVLGGPGPLRDLHEVRAVLGDEHAIVGDRTRKDGVIARAGSERGHGDDPFHVMARGPQSLQQRMRAAILIEQQPHDADEVPRAGAPRRLRRR